MTIDDQDNKFNVGDLVYTKQNSDVKMIVRKYYAKIYYCTFADEPMKKELALFERELVNSRE
ncbi:hypothetical protein [uncultured Algoriphagus sp.]|uniref:hypothetical protein n=1 Tax=uncultured Algoriphagus sp. TaxID=417365 RepID=UPI0030EC6BAB|tara:strand:+ start:34529 stop:34714 length:186 start_codon:yes stop_codon:yes gene_type:complete